MGINQAIVFKITDERNALKRRVQSFESGSIYVKQTEQIKRLQDLNIKLNNALEKKENECRSLKEEVKILKLQANASKKEKDKTDKLVEEIESLLNEMEDKYQEALRKIKELEKEKEDKNAKAKSLEHQLAQSSLNSSLPSSMDRPNQKRANEYNGRKKTGKKPGAQKGHPHHPRKNNYKANKSIIISPDSSILNNPDFEKTGKSKTRTLLDIVLSCDITNYISEEYRNKKTGEIYYPSFPDGIDNEVNYGSNLKTFISWLSSYCNVSIEKIKETIEEMTGGVISPSTGFISELQSKIATNMKDERNGIVSRLLASKALNVDLTNANVNSNSNFVMSITNGKDVLYDFMEHKNIECYDKTILGAFLGGLIHDHEVTLYRYGDRNLHQECLVHLLRYTRSAIEENDDINWPKLFYDFLQEIIKEYKDESIDNDDVHERAVKKLDNIIKTGETEYQISPPNKYEQEGYKLLNRISKYKNEMLLFLTNENFGYDNNIVERLNRIFKRKQKQVIVFRSQQSVQSYCTILSIIETAKLNNYSPYEAIKRYC